MNRHLFFIVILIFLSFAFLARRSQAQGAPQPINNLQLKRSYSGQKAKDNIVMLTYSNVVQEGGKIKANVKLVNATGTWVYAQQDFTPSVTAKTSVAGPARVYLLGPFSDKDLGTIEFTESSFLQFNAQSPVGLTGPVLSPQNRMLLGALAIDLIMRGLFKKELPSNAFDRPVLGGIGLGLATIDPLFNTITSNCSGSLGAFGYSLLQKDWQGIFNNLGKFALCTKKVKDKMKLWLLRYYTNKQTDTFIKKVSKQTVDILDAPTRITLMELLTKYTLKAPTQSWVRIEAIRMTSKEKAADYLPPDGIVLKYGNGSYEGSFLITKRKTPNGNILVNFPEAIVGGKDNCEVLTNSIKMHGAEQWGIFDPPVTIFRLPLKSHDSWTEDTFVSDPVHKPERRRFKVTVRGKEILKTPAGTFNCWKIEMIEYDNKGKIRYTDTTWYAKNIGVVRNLIIIHFVPGYKIDMRLKSITAEKNK
jgi:hypothetical protein